jgi:hypothetical protein
MLLVRGGSRVGDATRSSGSWSNPWIALSVGENELECLISSETGASAQETVYLSDARRCRELIFWRLRGFIRIGQPEGLVDALRSSVVAAARRERSGSRAKCGL